MSEFKIKVSCELDTSDLEGKLKGLAEGQEIELKLDMDKINSQIKEIKTALKDAFDVDKKFTNDLKAIANTLKKLNNNPLNDSVGGGSGGKPLNSLMQQYKELYKLRERLQKQMASGKLGDDSIARISEQIAKFTKQMNALKNSMSDSQKAGIKLFDTKQATKSLVDMHSYMNKIDSQADKIRKTISNIDMSNLGDGSKAELNDVLDTIEKIKNEAKDVRLDFDVSSSMNQLNDCYDTVKRIQNEAKEVGRSSRIGSRGINGMLGTWDDFKGNFAQFTLAEVAGDFIADSIRTTVRAWKDTIVETDAALTDLGKVAPESFSMQGEQLNSYLVNVAEVARGTGQTSIDIIKANASALQTGIKTIDDSLRYSEQLAILANTGDMTQETANRQVAGIMSAYGGVQNALKPVREQIQGASQDYSTLSKYVDLANHVGEFKRSGIK